MARHNREFVSISLNNILRLKTISVTLSHSLSKISVRGPFMVREHYSMVHEHYSMVHDKIIQLKASTSMSKMQYRRPSLFVAFVSCIFGYSNSNLKKSNLLFKQQSWTCYLLFCYSHLFRSFPCKSLYFV